MPPGSMYPGMMLGGRYRLEDLLSEHAGARFWRATDTVLARSVGVHAVTSDDPRAGLVLEASRRSATVGDPHFLRVLDCDDAEGMTWVVNEWGEGESLDLMVLQGPLPPARAAWLAREVAEAVVAAHAAGVPHGRLSPEAVMVTKSGAVKVIGFVVYAAIAGARPVAASYGEIDEREADVIDLAGILYAGLTGRWPGVAPSAVPPAPHEGRRPLRPRQVRAGVPRTLDAICDRVLNKEATQHTAPIETAYEILAALNDYVGDPTMAAPPDLPAMHDDPALGSAVDAVVVGAAGILPAGPALVDSPVPAPLVEPDPAPLVEPVETSAANSLPDAGPEVPAPMSLLTHDLEATMAAPMVLDETMPRVYDGVPPADLILGEDRDPVPPPPFEETPERPLFADHERRVPSTAPPTGTAGSPHWPFEDDQQTGTQAPTRPRRRRRTALAAAGLLLLAAVMYAAFLLGQDDGTPGAAAGPTQTPTASPTPGAAAVTGAPIKIVSVSDFDPEGDPPAENPDQAKLAVDGDPATGWQTERYKDSAQMGGLKSGVGLLLDLGSQQTISSIELRITGTPTSFEVYATAPGVNDAPAELADARRLTGMTAEVTNPVVRIEPSIQTRFVLIWLTKLPKTSDGFRGEINEVLVRP